MTISPFSGIAENATIRFQVATGVTEDMYGNVVASTSEIPVRCFLKVSGGRTPNNNPPGVPDTAIALDGYCVSPMILPSVVKPQTWAEATFDGTQGRFYLEYPLMEPLGNKEGIGALVESVAGTRIKGWFQVGRSG